jgi:hypothetical protein
VDPLETPRAPLWPWVASGVVIAVALTALIYFTK